MKICRKSCITAPMQILRFFTLMACVVITIYQLAECFRKLQSPPISTHTKIQFNKTMTYPAITVCQYPPYKLDVLREYNVGENIILTSTWEKFPWKNATLQEFWEKATYTVNESVPTYGIGSLATGKHIHINSQFYFENGRCFTFSSEYSTSTATMEEGWSLLLKHDLKGAELGIKSGWKIYIHDAHQHWTENPDQAEGLIEHHFLNAGNEMQIKLEATQMRSAQNFKNNPCSSNQSFTTTRCIEKCRWNELVRKVGCSAPWLPGIELAHCDNYDSYKLLTAEYLKYGRNNDKCGCMHPCDVNLYNTYVVDRQTMESQTYSLLYVYFTSKLIFVMEEMPGYDWNYFLADLGGSLGFLLGLSVLSVIGIIELMIQVILAKVQSPNTPYQIEGDNKEANTKNIYTNSALDEKKSEKYIEYLQSRY